MRALTAHLLLALLPLHSLLGPAAAASAPSQQRRLHQELLQQDEQRSDQVVDAVRSVQARTGRSVPSDIRLPLGPGGRVPDSDLPLDDSDPAVAPGFRRRSRSQRMTSQVSLWSCLLGLACCCLLGF